MSLQIRNFALLCFLVSQLLSYIFLALLVGHFYLKLQYDNNEINEILKCKFLTYFFILINKLHGWTDDQKTALFCLLYLTVNYNMTKMPPPSYLTNSRPGQRLQFPRPGDSSLFENSGRRHYHNHAIFSTPYALFQDDGKNNRNLNISLPQSRNITQENIKKQESVFNKYNQLKNNYVDNDYDRMKKQKDALDRQVINIQLNRESQIYSRPKQPEIQFKYAHKHQNIEKQYLKRSQVNPAQKNLANYSSIQPKRVDYYTSAQQLPFNNPKKINRQRIKTETTQMPQQHQHQNSALNRYVRFNPTYLSWIN